MSTLHPTCLLCFSACDAEGCLTSCDHYFCSRCAHRLPPASSGSPCPLCRKPFRTVPISHPGVQQLQHDPLLGIQGGLKAWQHQLSHHRQTAIRLKEALRLVHNRYTASEQRVAELEQVCARLREENSQLRQPRHHRTQTAAAERTDRTRPPSESAPPRECYDPAPYRRSRTPSQRPVPSPVGARQLWPASPSPAQQHVPSHPQAQGGAYGAAPTPPPPRLQQASAPLGWAATSATANMKRQRSSSDEPRHGGAHAGGPPLLAAMAPSPGRGSLGGAWEASRLSDTTAAGTGAERHHRPHERDDVGHANELRGDGGSSVGGGGGGHPPSPTRFRITTPLAQTLQRRPALLPDSAVVPPTPRLFNSSERTFGTGGGGGREHVLPSAPKPLQGLLDACFRSPL